MFGIVQVAEVETTAEGLPAHDVEGIRVEGGTAAEKPETGAAAVTDEGIGVVRIDMKYVVGGGKEAQERYKGYFHLTAAGDGVANSVSLAPAVVGVHAVIAHPDVAAFAGPVFGVDVFKPFLKGGIESCKFVPPAEVPAQISAEGRGGVCLLLSVSAEEIVEKGFQNHGMIEMAWRSRGFDVCYGRKIPGS